MTRGARLVCASLALASAALVHAQPSPRVVTYTPTSGAPTFAVREPVLRLAPGTVLESQTFSKPGDYYSPEGGPWPGEVGPFYIEGATPDDTLVVKVIKVRPNRDTAVSTIGPRLSAVAGDSGLKILNTPIPSRRYLWKLDRERMVGTLDIPQSASRRIELPLAPMLGRVAVAPAGGEAFGGLWPGNFGGNMDAADVREGTTVYLPIFHEGAYFYFGDGHALQGDGEICGSGLETTMDVTLEIDLIKGRRIAWPRFEDAEHLMVAGSARPLVDAFRIAQVELIDWLVDDYGFERFDAYQIVSQAGVSRIANVVDPNFTIVAKFPKKFLPPKVR
jgi:acetamidase/formamidase